MSLLRDREDNEWVDLVDALNSMEQSFPYLELITWLTKRSAHECGDGSDPQRAMVKGTTDAERCFLLGQRNGYARGIKAVAEFRSYCEDQLIKRSKRDARRA